MSITRSQVLWRAAHIWGYESVPYAQWGSGSPDGHRPDCSGYACAALNLQTSYNTATLVSSGQVYKIDINSLKPGDLIGKLGPGSEGDAGHVQVFEKWDSIGTPDNGHWVWEQTGPDGSKGPHRRHYADWRAGYAAYRFVGIVDDGVAPQPQTPPSSIPAWHLPQNEYYGNIKGPAESHGGYYAKEQDDVRLIQNAINKKGYGPISVDGVFGNQTEAAVARWQHAKMPGTQFYGQVWSDDWRALFS